MNTRIPEDAQHMTPETVDSLQELIYALKDSVDYHVEAADIINDAYVSGEFRAIASEREEIYKTISGFISLADSTTVVEGTLLGSLRKIWTAFRAALNAGDSTVILIEAERAEDAIKRKFEQTLTEIAGNPINEMLLKYYETVKAGHNRVLGLRNAYQTA